MSRILFYFVFLAVASHGYCDAEEPEDWQGFISQFHQFFALHEQGFDQIISQIGAQGPYSVERDGDSGLRVRWDVDSDPVTAPDDLAEGLLPLFREAKVYAVQYDPPVIQLGLTVSMISYRNFEILPVYVKASKLVNPVFCTEDLLINSSEKHGNCLLPLAAREEWFVAFTWLER